MLEIAVNQETMEEIYLGCLNQCFNSHASIKDYDWIFRRDSGASIADIIILKKDQELVAGSAVVYRTTSINGNKMKVGIMTGSWTLPAARGQGCFSKIIDESIRIAAENDAGLLLAFVTELNPSFRRLKDSGAALFPTFYLEAPCLYSLQEGNGTLEVLSNNDTELGKIFELFTAANERFSFFWYSYEHWHAQFVGRPTDILVVKIDTIGYAILEESEGFSRILCLLTLDSHMKGCAIGHLINRSFSLGKKLQSFTTDAAMKSTYEALGFNVLKGYLTANVASKKILGQAFGPEYRIAAEHYFYSQDNAFTIKPWMLQSGDRI